MEDNSFKKMPRKLDEEYRDPRRELERLDFEGMPKGKSSIANLDPFGFQKEVRYEESKKDGAN